MARPVIPIEVGRRFGSLKYLREGGIIKDRRHGIFICDCGREKSIWVYLVKSGNVVSCGCKRWPKGVSDGEKKRIKEKYKAGASLAELKKEFKRDRRTICRVLGIMQEAQPQDPTLFSWDGYGNGII